MAKNGSYSRYITPLTGREGMLFVNHLLRNCYGIVTGSATMRYERTEGLKSSKIGDV